MAIKIQHKRSGDKDKAPAAGALTPGELAINYNVDSPAAYIKDSAGNIVKLAGAGSASTPDASETVKGVAEIATKAEVTAGTDDERIVTPLKLKQAVDALPPGTTVAAAAPTTPEDGQAWFDSTNSVLKVWDGAAWKTSTPVVWTRGGGGLIPATAADNVFVGGTAAAPKISLKANGSATLASVLEGNSRISSVRSDLEAGFTNRTSINTTSNYTGSTDPYAFIVEREPAGGGPKEVACSIGIQGSASFASDVKIGGTLPASPSIKLNAAGTAMFTGTVTATVVPPSDQKFKENITPANPQLADVVALGKQLKNFDWNDDAPLNDELRAVRQLGLIAQEAEKVSPGIVKTIKRTKQGKELTPEKVIPAVYKDVVDPQDEENYSQELVTPEQIIPATYEEVDDSFKGISHDALIMKLLGAVAELSAEVEALKAVKTAKTRR